MPSRELDKERVFNLSELARTLNQDEVATLPLVVMVPEMADNQLTRARANRFLGSIALGGEVVLDDQQPYHSLLDAINQAHTDTNAYELVKANVASDVIERTLKAGHVTQKICMDIAEGGQLQQHGQSYLSVQANSLLRTKDHPLMRERTEAESLNAFRLEELIRYGALDDYSFVVFSKAENLPECFFTDTMSCSIQVTSKNGNQLETESAFVAGKTENGEMIDTPAIEAIYRQLAGVDISGKRAAEIIAMPLLIHNSLLPNGVVDMVKMYDQAAGGTFFGLDQPQQDYVRYKTACINRENGFTEVSLKIISELLASRGKLKTPDEASAKLNELSQRYTVDRALVDKTIDPRVFGWVAAGYILDARQALQAGQLEDMAEAMTKAQKTAVSSSCPTVGASVGRSAGGMEESSSSNKADSDDYGPLTFTCPKGHLNRRPRAKSPKDFLSNCKVCGTSLKCKK